MTLQRHTVAGSHDDFLRLDHLILSGTQREIGAELACIAHSELDLRKIPWTDPTTTRLQRAYLQQHWPEHAQRMLGVSDVLDISPEDDRFELSFLYYHFGFPGCSNAYFPPASTTSGHAILARNYDFSTGTVHELMDLDPVPGTPPATSRPFLLETHPSDGGYDSLCMTAYELLGGCLDGINSHGLAVALHSTTETLRSGEVEAVGCNAVGLSEIQLGRFLLERCASAREAYEALLYHKHVYLQVPCHYIVSDPSGDALVWGWSHRHNTPHVRWLEDDAALTSTNHLVGTPALAGAEDVRQESEDRLECLNSAIQEHMGSEGISEAGIRAASRAVAATHPAGEGQYQAVSPARTLWHAWDTHVILGLRALSEEGDSAYFKAVKLNGAPGESVLLHCAISTGQCEEVGPEPGSLVVAHPSIPMVVFESDPGVMLWTLAEGLSVIAPSGVTVAPEFLWMHENGRSVVFLEGVRPTDFNPSGRLGLWDVRQKRRLVLGDNVGSDVQVSDTHIAFTQNDTVSTSERSRNGAYVAALP